MLNLTQTCDEITKSVNKYMSEHFQEGFVSFRLLYLKNQGLTCYKIISVRNLSHCASQTLDLCGKKYLILNRRFKNFHE